jgi:hypothetical protein
MEPLGIVLLVLIVGPALYSVFTNKGSATGQPAPGSPEERADAARQRRSKAYDDVWADFNGGRISTAQRDAQLAHVSKWPIEAQTDGRGKP